MLYPELFKQLESLRWDMDKDIPWSSFHGSLLTDEQTQTIKMDAIAEWLEHWLDKQISLAGGAVGQAA